MMTEEQVNQAPESEDLENNQETTDEAVEEAVAEAEEVVEIMDEEAVDALAQMQARITELETELAAKDEEVLRVAAEAANLQRRMQRDLDNTRKFSNDKIIKALIPVMDSFDKALEVIGDDACEVTAEAMVEGTQNTQKIFGKVLADHGIEIVNPVGETFDPEIHEAMSMVPSPDHDKNTIVNVFQKGYLLHGRVIRAAMVVVAS